VDHLWEVLDLAEFRALPWWPRHGERTLSAEQKQAFDTYVASTANILSQRDSPGGQAGNVACALASCGIEVALISKVGDDLLASAALAGLNTVDLSGVARTGATSEAFVFVDQSGNRDILLWCPEEGIPSEIEGTLPDAEFIHFTSLRSIEQLLVQAKLAQQLKSTAKTILDTGNLYAEMGHQSLAPLLRHIDLLFATDKELEIMATSKEAARTLLFQDGLEAICEKSGPNGATLVARDGRAFHCDAAKVKAIDSTGAGDVLAATFIASVVNGASYEEALKASVSLASASVMHWGREGYPSIAGFGVMMNEMHRGRHSI